MGQRHRPYNPSRRSATTCMSQSPARILFPSTLEDGHCLQNIPQCPLCESRALRTGIGWMVEPGQWNRFQREAPMGSLASAGSPVSVCDSDGLSCRCCLIIKRFCFWQSCTFLSLYKLLLVIGGNI